MTRLPKLFAVLLALALGASGGVASLVACPHARAVAANAHARHDCCHAAHAHAMTHVASGEHAAHVATDVQTSNAHAGAHHADGCAASHAEHDQTAVLESALVGNDGSTCASCCAERAASAEPRTFAATNAQKSGHSDDARDAHAPHALALTVPLHRAFAPTQHAPPAASTRLHILISVLLI
jgi:3'-phosphoadenosine 5'-phosphosulfate (PAPS) 3'-phosphatase